MLDPDTLADIEADAALLLKIAGQPADELPDLLTLCVAVAGAPPVFASVHDEGLTIDVGVHWQVFVRANIPLPRRRWIVGHEISHAHYGRLGYIGADLEERCDVLGAALVVPAGVMRAAVRAHGHRVYTLATELETTQSLALLRLGEVTGRPVVLLRPTGPRARGADYGWPEDGPGLAKAVHRPPPDAHPIRLVDEGERWGLMGKRHG